MMRRSRFEQRITEPRQLLESVRYDREEGALYWLPRAPRDFAKNGEWSAPRWNGKFAGKRLGHVGVNGYRICNYYGDFFYEHRGIWFVEFGVWPFQVDHIDGDRTNNRIENLRNVDQFENNRNMARQHRNTSGYIGVRWHQESATFGRWKAMITVNYKVMTLYTGQSKEEAISARLAAEEKFGFHVNHGRKANASRYGKQ